MTRPGAGRIDVSNASETYGGERRHQILAGGAVAVVGSGTGTLMAFAVQVAIGRILGPENYGSYVTGLSLVRIALPVAVFGLNSAIVRFGAIYSSRRDEFGLRGAIFSAFKLSALTSGILSVVLISQARGLANLVFKDPAAESVLLAVALAIPFLASIELLAAVAQAARKIHLQQLIGRVARPGIHLGLVMFAALLGVGIAGIAWSYTIASVSAAILAVVLTVRVFPGLKSIRGSTFDIQRLIRFSIPVFVSGILYVLLSNLDRLMLAYFKEPTEVGIYNAAATLAMSMSLVFTAFTPISSSWMAELHDAGKTNDLSALYRSITRWTLILTLPVFFVLVFARESAMLIFGRSFVAATSILVVLSFGQLVNASTGPVGKLLEMAGKQDLNALALSVVVALNIILNLLLIPRLGGLGAAVATSASTGMVFVLLIAVASRELRLRLVDRSLLVILAAGGISFAFGIAISVLLDLGQVGTTMGGIFISVLTVVAFGGQLLLYGIPDEDRLLAINIARRVHTKLQAKNRE